LFTITVDGSFTASHALTYAGGETEDLHSHNWQVRVAVEVEELDENGLAVDFIDVKAKIDEITATLDNSQLEDLSCFEGINATAENVAKYIYDQLQPWLVTKAMLEYVEVMEAQGCWAKYSKE
jgi:6-pyruvoyltetrahydropterin/6-carboxytetrahydropterin synthase